MTKKALGKGLGAIFRNDGTLNGWSNGAAKTTADKARDVGSAASAVGDAAASYGNGTSLPSSDTSDVSRETLTVKTSLVEPNRKQPRQQFDESSLAELADSISKYGVLQPLLVRKTGLTYEIIAGERRWRAAKLAGLKEVPVIVKEFEPQAAAEVSLVENIQREDLGPVEEARAYQTLMQTYGLTQEEVAEKVSRNRSTIANSMRLLQLSDKVLAMLEAGKLSAGHARALIPVSDQKLQESLAQKVMDEGLNVRETEKLVKRQGSGKSTKTEDKQEQELDIYLVDLARKLTQNLNTKVLIRQGKKGKGKIEIEYYSDEDLEKIAGLLQQAQ